jgi:hypothetical protein
VHLPLFNASYLITIEKRELFGCYWKSYISFAVVGVSPTTLFACEDTSDGKKGNLYRRTKSLPAV